MVEMIEGLDIVEFRSRIAALEYHGTTAVFCEIDKNPYSWIYLPSCKHESHRIICTGNFACSNNDASIREERITATIEFTDKISKETIWITCLVSLSIQSILLIIITNVLIRFRTHILEK